MSFLKIFLIKLNKWNTNRKLHWCITMKKLCEEYRKRFMVELSNIDIRGDYKKYADISRKLNIVVDIKADYNKRYKELKQKKLKLKKELKDATER